MHRSVSPSCRAARSTWKNSGLIPPAPFGASGSVRQATVRSPATSSLRSRSCRTPLSGSKVVIPVTLAAVRPITPGSSTIAWTTGIVGVARCATSAATPPIAATTSGPRHSGSSASRGSRSSRPSAPAVSIAQFSPSISPRWPQALTQQEQVAALRVAKRLGESATVITLVCDSGLRYLSTDLFQGD